MIMCPPNNYICAAVTICDSLNDKHKKVYLSLNLSLSLLLASPLVSAIVVCSGSPYCLELQFDVCFSSLSIVC